MQIWNKAVDCILREEMEALQLLVLIELLVKR